MNGWRTILEAACGPATALENALRDPVTQQSELLAGILSANAQSAFGRAHGFARNRSIEEYRSAVPISSHAAYAPQIDRMADGEQGILTSAPVIAFEETGGSAQGAKLIPYTAASLAAFRAAVLPWLHDLAARRPALTKGRAYVAVSPATRMPRATAGGIPVGLATDAAYLGDDLVAPFVSLLATPPNLAAIAHVETWRIATLAHLVAAEDLAFVSVWSPTFFLELIAALPAHADAVAERLDRAGRSRLHRALAAGSIDTRVLWPRLDTISCWTDGTSSVYAARLADLCPQASMSPKGLLATEAAITVPWGSEPGCVPALTSTFLEFVAEDGGFETCTTLRHGERYRVVITTPGGLYRYDMGDIVRCVGFTHRAPRLVFEGRAALTSDLVGEKLDEAFVARALSSLGYPAALKPCPDPKPHYEVWVDCDTASATTLCEATPRIEAALSQNPQYAYARRIGQLHPLEVVARPGFHADHAARQIDQGRRLGDVKPLAILKQSVGKPGNPKQGG